MPHSYDPVQAEASDVYSAMLLLASRRETWDDEARLALEAVAPGAVGYRSPVLTDATPLPDMPWRWVQAALWQMYVNLVLLCEFDGPEYVHQARVGWRRLRCAIRLLKSIDYLPEAPDAEVLSPLGDRLGELRDLDVVRLDVLPRFVQAQAGMMGLAEWAHIDDGLAQSAARQREALRSILLRPDIGAGLWDYVVWLQALQSSGHALSGQQAPSHALQRWAREHVRAMHRKFRRTLKNAKDPVALHRARIQAKRLRYAVEDFAHLLPREARGWLRDAKKIQAGLGDARDLVRAADILALHGARELAAHLRVVAARLEAAALADK